MGEKQSGCEPHAGYYSSFSNEVQKRAQSDPNITLQAQKNQLFAGNLQIVIPCGKQD
jgi:hypothetical protein